jgi:AraC family transcriptional regulator, positive regulator of tynA and feaB
MQRTGALTRYRSYSVEAPLTFSTAQAPAHKRLGHWEELLSQRVLTLDIQSDRPAFEGRIVETPLAALRAYRISADHRQRARHTRLDLAPTDDERFCLIQLRDGGYELTARGRDANLALGDCVLVSTAEPFKFSCPEFTSCLVLRFDAAWMRRFNPNIRDLIGARIDGSSGWGRALSATLLNIEPNEVAGWSYPAMEVADHIGGLLSLNAANNSFDLSTPQRALLERARAELRSRFHETDMRPQSLANALGK